MSKQTTEQKLANAKALVAKYEEQLQREALANNVVIGDEVTFTFGRGETKRGIAGTVTGVRDDSNGRWVAVAVGEGFDATTYRIRSTDITANVQADKRKAAGADPLEQA